MKVLHLIDHFGIGGAQTVVKGILTIEKDQECFAIRNKENQIINIENVYFSKSKLKLDIRTLYKIKELIAKNNYYIIHCHLFGAYFYGYILKRIWFPNIKLVFHEHGKIFRNKWLYNFFLKHTQNKVDLFVVVSEATKQKLMENAGIPEEKIKVLYNFVDLKKFNPEIIKKYDTDKQRAKLGIEKNDFVVGFVGRLVHLKNVDKIIESLPLIIPEIPRIKLIVVGDGPEKKELQKLVNNLKLKEYVKFLGFRTDLPEIISTFDIGILVSDYENLSMYILELIALNKYVIATNVGGNPEIINNKIGRLIDKPTPHLILEAIKELQKTKKKISDFHEVKKKFALSLFIQDLENLYCSLEQR